MDYDPDSREADFPRTADRDGVLDAADSCVQDDPSLVPNETGVMGPRARNGAVLSATVVCVHGGNVPAAYQWDLMSVSS